MAPIEEFEIAAAAVSTKVVRSSTSEADRVISDLLSIIRATRIICDSKRVSLKSFVRSEPAAADCGITDADWGIASTGSLILPITVDRRRATSLLPPVSIILLDENCILPDLPAALGLLGSTYMQASPRPSCVIMVTGPSRTADIEVNLVMGVHGPKELIVVLTH
jgi:L-lactate dehydrogenase complex protein LldG